jgi:hypothetical protein
LLDCAYWAADGLDSITAPPIISGTTPAPSIEIQHGNPATINAGDTCTDLEAIVNDNQGHNLSYRPTSTARCTAIS